MRLRRHLYFTVRASSTRKGSCRLSKPPIHGDAFKRCTHSSPSHGFFDTCLTECAKLDIATISGLGRLRHSKGASVLIDSIQGRRCSMKCGYLTPHWTMVACATSYKQGFCTVGSSHSLRLPTTVPLQHYRRDLQPDSNLPGSDPPP